MEDSFVTLLEAINEIEDDYEPFNNKEDTEPCNDFILDDYESSDCSDSDDGEECYFYKDEVVDVFENNFIIKEEDNDTQEESIFLIWPPQTSPRGRNNVVNGPTGKLKHIKTSTMSTTVEHGKVKIYFLIKNKDELYKLASMFKSACSSMNDDCSVFNCVVRQCEHQDFIFPMILMR